MGPVVEDRTGSGSKDHTIVVLAFLAEVGCWLTADNVRTELLHA